MFMTPRRNEEESAYFLNMFHHTSDKSGLKVTLVQKIVFWLGVHYTEFDL